MKNLDLVSRRILVTALSITMVLCSLSLLIFSTSNANAMPTPERFVADGTNQIGRYQILETVSPAYKDASGNFNNPLTCALIWDTETGKSASYTQNFTTAAWTKDKASFQLPASPLQ